MVDKHLPRLNHTTNDSATMASTASASSSRATESPPPGYDEPPPSYDAGRSDFTSESIYHTEYPNQVSRSTMLNSVVSVGWLLAANDGPCVSHAPDTSNPLHLTFTSDTLTFAHMHIDQRHT